MRRIAPKVKIPVEKHLFRREVNSKQKVHTMGDKSPKSNQKKATQKQTKAAGAAQKKKQAVAAKSAGAKKK